MYIKKYNDFILESQPYVAPILLNLKDNVDMSLMGDIESFATVGDKILEISCGNGADANYLKSIGYDITCTELNDVYVNHCKGLGLDIIKHNTESPFPFTDKQFDITYSRLGLHYFSNESLILIFNEIARITKKYLIYTVKLVDDIPTGKIILSKEEWESITLNKFEIVSSNKKSGLLYGSQCNWLEVIAKVK